ncbi:aconitate hydratase AcnA [Paeniglutamicibacter psychrophenolicus]|uniref:Aconitate hydratase n=1 Tax=Paeniglutamicibacter psychrophenolicus TaxID=257454 RepID=A0ABS4WA91_9MICC|nr:aconitate hydratase AcnA [Paeniglutamicibacter psychrophenolicus]MBP2373111.1 aconitate hydratase [Paeniglutamicibacter psychrophenolicus]
MALQGRHGTIGFRANGRDYLATDVRGTFGDDFGRLPVVLRLLAENTLRRSSPHESARTVANLRQWLVRRTSQEELEFWPHRLLMHDTTSTPALVDIAGMRDSLAEIGIDPGILNPRLNVEVSVDHSLAVEEYAAKDAAPRNLAHEYRRNRERYSFLKWASASMETVNINPPGTGIMHTLNLEQLATLAHPESSGRDADAPTLIVPDMMIGTDSHTPMINGLGVLGWGVGGLEAQTVMFGMPTTLRIPDVIGFRLTGSLPVGATATDLALTITHMLRTRGVSGEFVEFFGPGISTLSIGERAVVSNMAPEYGATTGYFPVDHHALEYLEDTGRPEKQLGLVESFYKAVGLWFDPAATPEYTDVLELDLSAVSLRAAGPRRPQDLRTLEEVPRVLAGESNGVAEDASELPRFAIALASITSCTNTTDPKLLVAAGLLARKARTLGLVVPHWVKTSLAPGSPAAASYLRRAGLLEDLGSVGFDIVGFGCTTCIGNSGALSAPIAGELAAGSIRPVAVLSGNRNFAGRIHPDLDLGFLMSPPLVIAYALAGRADVDLQSHEFAPATADRPAVTLNDLLPTAEEIDAAWAQGHDSSDFARDFALATANPLWNKLAHPQGAQFAWDPDSTILRRPPFASLEAGSQLGSYAAHPLLVLGDDVTTDHISPASAIPAESGVADYLVERGESRQDLNVFASRRGNWEVMLRGGFHAKSVHNKLGDSLAEPLPVAHTVHAPTGEVIPLHEAANRYADAGESVVIIAGERFGTGSSRDWAAKVQRLLGVRAVLATSFERIHRSNLIGMGVLPLLVPETVRARLQELVPGDTIDIAAEPGSMAVRADIHVRLTRRNGEVEDFMARAAVETELEVALLRSGGVIPHLLRSTIDAARATKIQAR